MNAPLPHIARFNRRAVIDVPINTLNGFDANKAYTAVVERSCLDNTIIRFIADLAIDILCNSIIRFSFALKNDECDKHRGIFDFKIIEFTSPNGIIFQTKIQIL